jgi:hypothetical protein
MTVVVLDDPTKGLGPLQGIAVGLAALVDGVEVAFVSHRCAVLEPRIGPFDACAWLRLDEAALVADPELLAADPELEPVVNVKASADYALALGRPAPLFRCDGAEHGRGRRTTSASPQSERPETDEVTWGPTGVRHRERRPGRRRR